MTLEKTQIQTHEIDNARLAREVSFCKDPVLWKSIWQIVNSYGGFVGVCFLMYLAFDVSYWISLGMAPLAAGFLVRIFIIQHDCGHKSFFRSRWANEVIGRLSSLLTLTPFATWRRQHAGHHRIWNDLDRRDNGLDIYSHCLTVSEYNSMSPTGRLWYRVTRHPLVANVLLPPIVFLTLFRLPFDAPKAWRRERLEVHLTNVALAAGLVGLGVFTGFGALVAVQLPVIAAASIIGVWLFSVQHRFEGVKWARHDEWQYQDAALHGSSYLRMPRVLQWFSGNIGFHHIHHLNPRVPNYRLEECHKRIKALCNVPQISFLGGIRATRLALWDEKRQEMVTFRHAARLQPA